MGSTEAFDPYLEPGTRYLRNLVGATSARELEIAEADLSFARALQLLDTPVAFTNDLRELCAIHRHLFQDVFEWAGQIRTIDVKKNVPNAEFFLPHRDIERASYFSFEELSAENYLQNLGREDFIARLAFHYEKINYIHPFREGNGRTQRIFWNRVALDAGWQLDWRIVHGEENHSAARAGSDQLDLGPLIRMFDKIVTRPDDQGSSSWATNEIERLSIRNKPDS